MVLMIIIACLLETHLRVSPIMSMLFYKMYIIIVVQNRGQTDLLHKTTFGVPIFHVHVVFYKMYSCTESWTD